MMREVGDAGRRWRRKPMTREADDAGEVPLQRKQGSL